MQQLPGKSNPEEVSLFSRGYIPVIVYRTENTDNLTGLRAILEALAQAHPGGACVFYAHIPPATGRQGKR